MGKTKKLFDFDFDFELNENEMYEELYSRNDYDYQYKKWQESEDYVEFVNSEINTARPIYTEYDIEMNKLRHLNILLSNQVKLVKKFMISYLKKNYKNI